MAHADRTAMEAGLDHVRSSPRSSGLVERLARRPAENAREVLAEAELDPAVGLVGDNWGTRGSGQTADGSAHPELQVTVMNSRAATVVAGDDWELAGDQLYVDLDLSVANVPPGTRLAVGNAVIEVTAEPHRGCGKFAARFGVDALKLVNSEAGRELNLRGVNARVISGGLVRPGDEIRKLAA
jgi:hypothetical protein